MGSSDREQHLKNEFDGFGILLIPLHPESPLHLEQHERYQMLDQYFDISLSLLKVIEPFHPSVQSAVFYEHNDPDVRPTRSYYSGRPPHRFHTSSHKILLQPLFDGRHQGRHREQKRYWKPRTQRLIGCFPLSG